MIAISTPYARRGELWRAHKKHYGQDGDVLVWQADTRTMNGTVPQAVIDRAFAEDPSVASAEYSAIFRTDIESFISREAVEQCLVLDRSELPPVEGVSYASFVDPSGGSSDSMTLAIGHKQDEAVVVDCIRERKPPFSPGTVVAEFVETLKAYRVHTVVGDRYGGEWPREQFRKVGVVCPCADRPPHPALVQATCTPPSRPSCPSG